MEEEGKEAEGTKENASSWPPAPSPPSCAVILVIA